MPEMGSRAGSGVEIHLNRLDEWPALEGLRPALREAIGRTLRAAGGEAGGEISVTCLPEAEMEAMNREYLGRDGPTDVIAFDLGGGGSGSPEDALLGDIYVSPEAAREAASRGHAAGTRSELLRLAVHGTLHLLGHDHPEDDSRWSSPMFRLQERILSGMRRAEAAE